MFQAIVKNDLVELQRLGENFDQNDPAALLCLDHAFTNMPNIQESTVHEVDETLCSFLRYARLLQSFACRADPCSDAGTMRLFGLQVGANHAFVIPPGTFLHHRLTHDRSFVVQSQDNVMINAWELTAKLKKYLHEHLQDRVSAENQLCQEVQAFTPCVPFLITRHCNRTECPRKHLAAAALTPEFYGVRVRIHMRQMLILQTLHFISMDQDRRKDTDAQQWCVLINCLLDGVSMISAGIGSAGCMRHCILSITIWVLRTPQPAPSRRRHYLS
jgi:flagellar biosynthesis regulator FlaF